MRFTIVHTVILFISTGITLGAEDEQAMHSRIQACFEKLPLYFIENQGQIDNEDVAYYVKGADKTLYFTPEGIAFALAGEESDGKKRWCLRLEFVDANPDVKPAGKDKQEAVFSYFRGKPEDWITNLATYQSLAYKNLWPGIDLVYSGTVNRLKYEFVVKPGADPSRIRLAYCGASEVYVEKTGALKVSTPLGGFEDGKPYAYQMLDGKLKEVSMQYVLGENDDDTYSFGFDLGAYESTKTLVLDPNMLVYCGYIGGNNDEGSVDLALDGLGRAYVTGGTNSDETSFPVKVGPDLTFNGNPGDYDAFVARVNAEGTELEYCGYIGGVGFDYGGGIAVDSAGRAYVTGRVNANQSTFPEKIGPDLSYNGAQDAFVARVNAQGTDLDYCGYIGGIDEEGASGIAVDNLGRAYVTGYTRSNQSTFPVSIGPDLTFNGYYDAYVARVNAQGSGLEYCGYIGGSEWDVGYGIAVDGQGNAYVTGSTVSNQWSFPETVGPDVSHNGAQDGFVAKVNSTGNGLSYCGYIGGTKNDIGNDITVDGQGNAYVTGSTESDEASFPVTVGPDLTYNGGYWDAFVAKVNTQGKSLVYCGYIGGSDGEGASAIAVDDQDNAFITGKTGSDESSFPVKIGPDLSHNGMSDTFVARINALGLNLDYCGYIGGSGNDGGGGIAVDGTGNAYVSGSTTSDESSFPLIAGPDLKHNGSEDAFVAKIMRLSFMADTYELSESTGGTVNFILDAGPVHLNRDYFILGSISGTEPGTLLPKGKVVLPLNWDLFTNVVLDMVNTPVFSGFQGKLDGQGAGSAALNLPPVPGAAGITMHFAYAVNNPWDFTSNPVGIKIVL